MKFEFSVDRGGTFTDIFCVLYSDDGTMTGVDRTKLLSEDPHYDDSVSEGIRRIISKHLNRPIEGPIPASLLVSIRIGTTIGTNALLERKGAATGLLMTKGFKDLLKIGNQSRPKIFELNIHKFGTLFQEVIEIEERIEVSSPYDPMPEDGSEIEKYQVVTPLDKEQVRRQLENLKAAGIESIAISLMHAYIYPQHEQEIAAIAREVGFAHVFTSHEASNKLGYLARSSTCLLDAYLYPVIQKYFARILRNFENDGKDIPIYLMQSDGALAGLNDFTGSKSILSGPAGGVAGFSKTTIFGGQLSKKVIGFDMGGTSTDVSTFEGTYEMNYESEIAGTFVSTPHLDINTVAAGGGSCLTFSSQMLRVGPESAGSHPGPVCYGKKGHLAVTDANLMLGRILPNLFPKIFGPNQDQPLDKVQTQEQFKALADKVRQSEPRYKEYTDEEIAFGFIQVANEVMCRPIRALTESRGKDPKHFDLAVFGGAGAQHACAVAANLGINTVFVHKYSSVLSAYGIFVADIVNEASLYYNLDIEDVDPASLTDEIKQSQTAIESHNQVREGDLYDVSYDISYVLKYNGSESLITVHHAGSVEKAIDVEAIRKTFTEIHLETFGFLLEKRPIHLFNVFIKRRMARKDLSSLQSLERPVAQTESFPLLYTETYFADLETGRPKCVKTPIYEEESLVAGTLIEGPALVVMNGSTIVVEPGWQCLYNEQLNYELRRTQAKTSSNVSALEKDPVTLSIFGQRFMSIAEQMGRRLQRTALSTNIKERLDFSCAVFGPDGSLVANAPHLPVHLGSMESTVTYQIETLGDKLKEGDVVISNHPKAGGSHLPDITAITPCFYHGKPIFYVASRGHHSDIGGKTPGSMPAFAESIKEEGVAFKSFKIVEGGLFQEDALREALSNPGEGITGSRCVEENVSDLKAQAAANRRGVELLQSLVGEYSLEVVHGYMGFIQQAAEASVREMLTAISISNGMKEIDTVSRDDYMDDGTMIALDLTINRKDQTAVFDFRRSGLQVLGNFNTPPSVLRSAVIYCLRCLVDSDIPLNAGCLRPVTILAQEGSVLSPSESAAIVGGNVTTSQRITDVVFKAFKAAADSQGCMNNFTFGDPCFGYYETIAGGAGAGPGWHGADAVQVHMTNTRITDPEVFESRFPVVLLQFAIRPNSGGKGRYHGGNGVVREFRFKKELQVSILSERRVFWPEGICGGGNGTRGVNTLTYPDGREVNVGGKCSIIVQPGTKFKVQTPGGGAYGEPSNESQTEDSQQPTSKIPVVAAGSLHAYQMLQEQA